MACSYRRFAFPSAWCLQSIASAGTPPREPKALFGARPGERCGADRRVLPHARAWFCLARGDRSHSSPGSHRHGNLAARRPAPDGHRYGRRLSAERSVRISSHPECAMGGMHGHIPASAARPCTRRKMVADAPYFPACRSHRRIRLMSIALPTRPVGRTKLSVPELGFGAAPLGNLYRATSDDEARDTVLAALQGGITHFDTAPYYGFGLSERRLGDAVRGHESVVISTKVGRLLKPDPTIRGSGSRHGFYSPMPFQPVYD